MKIIKFLAAVTGALAIILTSLSVWTTRNFGDVSIDQAVWHIFHSRLTGMNPDYVVRGIKYLASTTAYILLWLSIVYLNHYLISAVKIGCKLLKQTLLRLKQAAKASPPPTSKAVNVLLLILGVSGCCLVAADVNRKFKISDYIKYSYLTETTDFIQAHYHVPAPEDIRFEKQNNLVIVSVESLENSFAHKALDQSYIPNLAQLRQHSARHPCLLTLTGTSWTIGAFTGHFFGLPLKTPAGIEGNSYRDERGFLPGALSIFDILKSNGYETVLVIGTDSSFQSKDQLFPQHGAFRILDRKYFESAGWSLEEHGGTGWGFSDEFVLKRAAEEYAHLQKAGKPFVLFVETVDTHSPDGYCPAELKKYHDIRDAILNSDRNLGEFSKLFTEQDGLVYVVLGDHLFMGNPDFLAPVEQRTIYNIFHGNLPEIPAVKQQGKVSALDIAPTLLWCAGARWGNNSEQFGLGINLFSETPSLLEQYGEAEFNKLLLQKSALYSRFYESPDRGNAF